MCLAVPMKIVAMEDAATGTAEADGVQYTVDLSMLESPQIGDYVVVHAGFAIEKLDQEEADARIALFEDLAESNTEKP